MGQITATGKHVTLCAYNNKGFEFEFKYGFSAVRDGIFV